MVYRPTVPGYGTSYSLEVGAFMQHYGWWCRDRCYISFSLHFKDFPRKATLLIAGKAAIGVPVLSLGLGPAMPFCMT